MHAQQFYPDDENANGHYKVETSGKGGYDQRSAN
jgi:hypothetical protein